MQAGFHLLVNGEKILVLGRETKYHRSLKLRKSGKDGRYLPDESAFLSMPENQNFVEKLLKGEVINL